MGKLPVFAISKKQAQDLWRVRSTRRQGGTSSYARRAFLWHVCSADNTKDDGTLFIEARTKVVTWHVGRSHPAQSRQSGQS
jgi:hypothetical protein